MAMEQILELLQEDAKLTPKQLSVMLGEDEGAVESAIKRYERDGVIKGYHTLVNWERTETHKATALIELRVSPQKDTGFDEIAGRIMNFPEVESVYLMSKYKDGGVVFNSDYEEIDERGSNLCD